MFGELSSFHLDCTVVREQSALKTSKSGVCALVWIRGTAIVKAVQVEERFD